MSNYYEFMKNGATAKAEDISEAHPTENETLSPATPGYGSVNTGLEKLPEAATEETAPMDHSEIVSDDPVSDVVKTDYSDKSGDDEPPELPPSLGGKKKDDSAEIAKEVGEWKAKLSVAKEDELRGLLDEIEAMTDESRQSAILAAFKSECDKRAGAYNEKLNNGEWI